jgi:hypothetical protein
MPLAAESNMGRSRAYHLIEVSRTVEALAIPRDQLGKIGWPKLQLFAKHLTPDTLDALLRLAEESTMEDLTIVWHCRGFRQHLVTSALSSVQRGSSPMLLGQVISSLSRRIH